MAGASTRVAPSLVRFGIVALSAGIALDFLLQSAVRPVPPLTAGAKRSSVLGEDLQELFASVAEEVRPSVVFISATRKIPVPESIEHFERLVQGQRELRQRSQGSGVVVDPRGYILTNHHVILESEELIVKAWNGQVFPARLIQKEEGVDIALLKVENCNLPAASLGNSENIKVGHWVLAIGSPFGLAQSVSAGIVSAVGRSDLGILPYESFIQTDASINQGNSGGPLIDLQGRVVGINTAVFSDSCGASMGIGFAVPVNIAHALVENWIRGRNSSVSGLKPVRLDADGARYFGLSESGGALIEEVEAGSPAEAAGLRAMDIVVRFNGNKVRDENHLRYLLVRAESDKPIDVEVARPESGEPPRSIVLQLTLTRSDLPPPVNSTHVGGHEVGARMLGITVVPMGSEIARHVEAPEGVAGVVVIDVDVNSSAEAKGVREGDVIVEANQKPVTDLPSLHAALGNLAAKGTQTGDVVMLRILRGGRDAGYKFLPR